MHIAFPSTAIAMMLIVLMWQQDKIMLFLELCSPNQKIKAILCLRARAAKITTLLLYPCCVARLLSASKACAIAPNTLLSS
jgi:hypothetical protein